MGEEKNHSLLNKIKILPERIVTVKSFEAIEIRFDELMKVDNSLPPVFGSLCLLSDPPTRDNRNPWEFPGNVCICIWSIKKWKKIPGEIFWARTYKFICKLRLNLNRYTDFSNEIEVQMRSGNRVPINIFIYIKYRISRH